MIPENSYDNDKSVKYGVKSVQHCQVECQEAFSCYFFQYNIKDKACWLKNDVALLSVKQNTASNKFININYTSTNGFTFGPKFCHGRLYPIYTILVV